MTAPAYIRNHPGVSEYHTGESQASDYRHWVVLKDGWKFTEGRCAGGSSLFFNSKSDFEFAEPRKETK